MVAGGQWWVGGGGGEADGTHHISPERRKSQKPVMIAALGINSSYYNWQ